MRVLLDDVLLNVTGCTVADAVAQASARAAKTGRLIIEVNVDGHDWSGDRVNTIHHNRETPAEVRFRSQAAATLAREAFEDAAAALAQADELQRSAAHALQSDRRTDAFTALAQAVEIWQGVDRAVSLAAQAAGLNLTGLDQTPAATQLAKTLSTIRSTMTAGDQVGLADALLYEMPSVVQAWRSLLCDLQEQAAAAATSGERI